MANKTLFSSWMGKLVPASDARNEAGGVAYRLGPKGALAQYAATGCLNGTYYASAEEQLQTVLSLCEQVEPEFIARTAVYCRQKGHMKDVPALLCAVVSVKAPSLFERTFAKVITDGRMLRTFVQVMRSGVVGRKSLGTMPKRAIRHWLDSQSDEGILRASVGTSPSLGDVVKMVHPRPGTDARRALYGWLIDRKHDPAQLPELVKQFEAFKATRAGELPDVPFQMLTALPLGSAEWVAIARNAGWQMTRMNLQTFSRHGVFEVPGMTELIAARLRDPEAIRHARVFPYQLLMAFAMSDGLPAEVRDALQDALEHSLVNVPAIDGRVFIFPDVSGSMSSPITGHRDGATTKVRCIDVAALFTAALMRKNPRAEVLPFAERMKPVVLNPRDSIATNAAKLAALGGGGTNCSAPLAELNQRRAKGDLVIYLSDNQSWVDAGHGRGTATMQAWETFAARNRDAKLVCIDLQPYGTTQAQERADVLNVGGFSDQVFEVISEFARGGLAEAHWVAAIESVSL